MGASLTQHVRERAAGRCEYCGLPQAATSVPFEIDHIIARKHGGPTIASNLAIACSYCNSFKDLDIAGLDPKTKKLTRLFHPRRHRWTWHFRWDSPVADRADRHWPDHHSGAENQLRGSRDAAGIADGGRAVLTAVTPIKFSARGPSPSGDGGIADFLLDCGAQALYDPPMQIGVLKIKIRTPNLGKAGRLATLADEFTACVRFHWGRIEVLKTTNVTEIHRDCYREARKLFRLPASTIQQARDKAVAAYRSYRERKKRDRRCQPPTFPRTLPLRLAAENLRVFADRSVVRITTPDGFLWLPMVVPACFADQIKLKHAVSEVVRRGKDWFLMLAVKSPDVPTPEGERPHFGIDLGLANLAVLAGPGIARFFDGKPLWYVRGRYFRYRQALQKKRKVGMVMRSQGNEARWATCENHRVTRAIVDIVAFAGGVIHVERLTGIRERCKGTAKVNRMIASWPFAQFGEFLRYKAAMAGVPVIEDDPRHTRLAQGQVVLERGALAGEALILRGRHHDHGVLAAADALGAFGQGEVDDLAESILRLGQVPWHREPPCLARRSRSILSRSR